MGVNNYSTRGLQKMVSYDTLELRLFKMSKYGNRKIWKVFYKPSQLQTPSYKHKLVFWLQIQALE